MDQEYTDQQHANALIASRLIGEVLTEKTDIGPERVKLSMHAISEYHRFLGTKVHNRTLNFAIVDAIADDREALKKMVKRQALLPER